MLARLKQFFTREFHVKPHGRAGFTYKEPNQSVYVFSEFLVSDKYDLVAYLSRCTEWDNDGSPLTSEDRERIKQNVEKALRMKIEWA